jgi:outer membrane cobalamin receptor
MGCFVSAGTARLALLVAAAMLGVTTTAAAAEAVATAVADDQSIVVTGVDVLGRPPSATSGAKVSASGSNDYGITNQDIANLPLGATSALTDVLAQAPGVAIDENQQIHIRNTEGPQFQYQINGVLLPFDINTNPPFLTFINPLFIKNLDLLDGILPSRYSYATGGVVSIQTKDGCEQPGGSLSVTVGMRQALEPSAEFGGCAGKFSYYLSGLYSSGQNAFSSATPGPTPIHDYGATGQVFGFFTYDPDPHNRISLTVSADTSNNQLPNVANLAPQFTLAGATDFQSADINSYLNFRDIFGSLALNGSNGPLTYQLAYTAHFISQAFRPDNEGELIFQGVASTATHYDIDNTVEGDISYALGAHTLSAGFYAGFYLVKVDNSSLVFPIDESGNQTSSVPETVASSIRADNVVTGVYVNDLWQITRRLRANAGVRFDSLTGFSKRQQVNPTLNLTYAVTDDLSVHGGVARYMQVPSFQGVSPNASELFAGTTAASPPGIVNPLAEDDVEIDAGAVWRMGAHLTLSQDSFYERTWHYLDTGQFGVVPIFAPFNYGRGYIWGTELAVNYRTPALSTYANLTLGQNWQKGVDTGQFNFDPDELAFINAHPILLDHQPLVGVSAGGAYRFGPYKLSFDFIYSSGLRGGFADQEALPQVIQLNGALERGFRIPGVGEFLDRLTVLNVSDRVNLIRPAEGIGIFQSAYGPRITVLDTLTYRF